MSYENILYEVQGPMALLTINRADRHNAISLGTLDDLHSAVAAAAADGRERKNKGPGYGLWQAPIRHRFPRYDARRQLKGTTEPHCGRRGASLPPKRVLSSMVRSRSHPELLA